MASPARPSSTPRDSSVSSTSTVGRQKQAPNGVRARPTSTSTKDTQTDSSTSDQQSHDRLTFLLANFVGLPVRLTTKAGIVYSGIFSKVNFDQLDTIYKLKMAKQLSPVSNQLSNGNVDSDAYVGSGNDYEMSFAKDDVHLLSATDITLDKHHQKMANGTSSTFRTDTDISGNRATKERELQPWQPSDDLDSSSAVQSNGGASSGWDQFEANERLYGVKSDYDENMYTTSIDRLAPSYKQRVAAADRKAREIEGAAGGSFQSLEDDDNLNEEERFSGVRREPQPLATSSANRYTTPAKRPPTAMPASSRVPNDPAIISSQLARPTSASIRQSSPAAGVASRNDGPKKENAAVHQDTPATSTASAAAASLLGKSVPPSEAELAPGKAAGTTTQSRSPGTKPNATETVATDLLESFKTFSANEKMRVQEQQRRGARRDKDVKINDLKKFAANFKLGRPVPRDMLGILAKDEKKQKEIIQKSEQELEEKKSPAKTAQVPEPTPQQTPNPGRLEPTSSAPAPAEPSSARGGKNGGNHGFQGAKNEKFQNGHGNSGGSRGGSIGTFGQRKIRQYAPGSIPTMQQMQQMPPTGPAAIRTDIHMPRGPQIPTPNSAASSRFNVQAMEFRPNPTTSMFSPPLQTSSMSTSQAASRSVSKPHSPSKKSFFENGRPKPVSEKRDIRDYFNPIKRMKQEADKDRKTKETNDGIPPAYTTRPTWDVTKENENKTYMDVLERSAPPTAPMMAPNGILPHQHQLPVHLQQNGLPPSHGPQSTPRFGQPPMQQGPRDHHFDDPRMQYSSSQSSMYPSPRPQQNSMNQPPPMGSHGQPMYMQPQFVMAGPNGQMMPYRQGPGGPPQMMNGQPGQMMQMPMPMQEGPGNGHFMNVPGQQGMVFPSPGPGHVYPVQNGPQGHSAYSSPRPPAPMMMHQGSQQGHGPPMMYPSGSQQGQPMYYMPPQNQQMGQMRGGGYPMQPQGSYGASPHMQYQQPMQRGGPQHFGNCPPQQQQMHPG